MSQINIERKELTNYDSRKAVRDMFFTRRVFDRLCHDQVNPDYIIDSIMEKCDYIYLAKRKNIIMGFATVENQDEAWYIDVICVGRQHSMKSRSMMNSGMVKGAQLLNRIKNDASREAGKPVELSSLAHVYGYYKKQGFVPVNRKTRKQIRFPRGRSILALNNAFKSKQGAMSNAINNGYFMRAPLTGSGKHSKKNRKKKKSKRTKRTKRKN